MSLNLGSLSCGFNSAYSNTCSVFHGLKIFSFFPISLPITVQLLRTNLGFFCVIFYVLLQPAK